MSWPNWLCIGTIVLGLVLFLYGANYYDAVVGYAGIYVILAGIIAMLVLYVYREMTKK
jgi:multisubunit Na+/H+ antiporter MnhF subunit